MPEYIDFLATRGDLAFIYVVMAVVFLLNLTLYTTFNEKLILTTVMIASVYFFYAYTAESFKTWKGENANFDEDVTRTTNSESLTYEALFDSNITIHKLPKHFKYILKHEDALAVMKSISFLKRFDDASYKRMLMLFEGFFKHYDKILRSHEPELCNRYLTIMQDVRIDVLNEVSRTHFGVPERFAQKIQKAIQSIMTMTYRCIKVASRRCEKVSGVTMLAHRPPYPSGSIISEHNLF
jgi:hypothetical protein